ncbi:uncharacterized protein LOC102463834 isoform X4 [Pelodiscus sinensis]|uniref:uncharacterized protein LOC102463834 isoform X4 n=1 Tax=Pelodiscus sinensis TaxID=13735 RepID=UPI003F6D898A
MLTPRQPFKYKVHCKQSSMRREMDCSAHLLLIISLCCAGGMSSGFSETVYGSLGSPTLLSITPEFQNLSEQFGQAVWRLGVSAQQRRPVIIRCERNSCKNYMKERIKFHPQNFSLEIQETRRTDAELYEYTVIKGPEEESLHLRLEVYGGQQDPGQRELHRDPELRGGARGQRDVHLGLQRGKSLPAVPAQRQLHAPLPQPAEKQLHLHVQHQQPRQLAGNPLQLLGGVQRRARRLPRDDARGEIRRAGLCGSDLCRACRGLALTPRQGGPLPAEGGQGNLHNLLSSPEGGEAENQSPPSPRGELGVQHHLRGSHQPAPRHHPDP